MLRDDCRARAPLLDPSKFRERNMDNDEKRVSHEYAELFHYTNVSAFEQIFRSRELWATHYRDLNDSSELHRFRLKVSKFIAPLMREILRKRMPRNAQVFENLDRHGGMDAVVEREAEIQVDVLHRNTFGEGALGEGTFICSFCAHAADSPESKHGLLSQWRGYGLGGVAIVLDTKGIEAMMQHEKDVYAHPINHIGDVKYDDDDKA
jgi:hypothetical protein